MERDGNASDEIRGTRVPRVTQGQLDSRPFKRDYVQRPSSLVLSLSLALSLSFFARAKEKGVFSIFEGFFCRLISLLLLSCSLMVLFFLFGRREDNYVF